MRRSLILPFSLTILLAATATPARGADTLCDTSFENCRDPLIQLIRNETVQIDVAFWFMEDARYTNELIAKWQSGVRVRVLVDPRANTSTPANADRLSELANAGIPMRKRIASGILHWKTMIFKAQRKVEFSAANYSGEAFVPADPYNNYTDEVIYFTDQASIVDSFMTKYDDAWVDTTSYANYANISGVLARDHATSSIDPELNFPPSQNYATRAVSRYNAETQKIDVIMYRITDRRHTDAIIKAIARGIPVRLITEPEQYRDPKRLWHSWNVDRLYVAGVQIRHRRHLGLLHQKSVLLYGLGMTIFGSSNWTSPSANSQAEHNYFTTKPVFFDYFRDQFERKWNNATGNLETEPFVPLPPDSPAYRAPSDGATGLSTSVTLTWFAGPWAHKYDILVGTTPTSLNAVASDLELGPSESSTDVQQYTLSNLASGTTYYWRIVSKTMANQSRTGPIWSFTTGGTPTPPPVNGTLGPGDILLYAGAGTPHGSTWQAAADSTAAGGMRMWDPNQNAGKVTTALASPANYVEMTFTAAAGVGYRLWMRAKAEADYWANDSVHVQFSDSVDSGGTPVFRIGTSGSTVVNLENCSGCGVQGWGWQDNGYGINVFGPLIYFAASGTHTIRVQRREDGMSIDQIMLSPQTFRSTAPGTLKNDTTIYPSTEGGPTTTPPPPPTSTDIVLYASHAVAVGSWVVESDSTAAGGALIHNPNAGASKVVTALTNPANYIELTFDAEAGVPYHLWIRGRAESNDWANDSVHVQFSDSVTSTGAATFRIGTTSSTAWNLEDCSGCGLSSWGWQDNGWGVNVMGPDIYFASSGTHTIRIQVREDGVMLDQIVLSPQRFLTSAPGQLKNDTTIYAESGGV